MQKNGLKYLVPALGLAMTACGGGSSNSISDGADDGGASYQQAVVNAQTESGYLNLITGKTVGKDDVWHVAFNRTAAMLNSGESGEGNVGGALGDAQAEFYKASGEPDLNVFLNASPDTQLSHLKDTFPEPATWKSDGMAYAFGDAWSEYAGGVISETPGIGYLIRSAEGDSYARMRILDFNFPTREVDENGKPKGIQSFDLEFEVQAPGTVQLSGSTIHFTEPADYDGGDACFDFDAGVAVDCEISDTWDVLIGFSGREWYLKTNSGPSGPGSGAVVGPFDWSELKDYTSATTDPSGQSLKPAYVSDSTGGIFTDHIWYEYNLQGAHKLWPNYRVYLINTDTKTESAPVYALQIISYYGEDGTSGQPVIRWKPITLTTEE